MTIDPDLLARFESFDPSHPDPDTQILQNGRNLTVRCMLDGVDTVVKRFPARSPFRALLDRIASHEAKPTRSYEAARHLHTHNPGSTPEPLWFHQAADGSGLFATRHEEGLVSFTAQLAELYAKHGPGPDLIALLERIAPACRALHDSGFFHGDLGNQNILLAPDGRVLFIDLNRCRIVPEGGLPNKLRARDLSRIALPSDFLRVFFEMYWGAPPPKDFLRAERRFRKAYALHSATRRLRHPFRPRRPANEPTYPPMRDIWIWDPRSEQALVTLRPRDRRKYQSTSRVFEPIRALLPRLDRIRRHDETLRALAFERPILSFASRAFVSLSAEPGRFTRELDHLSRLDCPGVHLRFYAHEPRETAVFKIDAVRRLRSLGHAVAISLVQSRDSVLDPAGWEMFCGFVLSALHAEVMWVEYLHAVNRVKWGFWNFRELRGLYAVLTRLREKFPDVAFLAPSVIDFEWDYLAAALRLLPAAKHPLAGLSAELYVDRRGAPENRQGRYDAVGKLRLFRAIAGSFSDKIENHLVVTEWNWPLAGTGVWSPVGAPYVSPGARFNDPSVSEDAAAAYSLRYLLLGICSGLADSMVFWSLSAHGFGLVDPGTGPVAVWRERPAFHALAFFFSLLRHGSYTDSPYRGGSNGLWLLRFTTPDARRIAIAWSVNGTRHAPSPEELGFAPTEAFDLYGKPTALDTPLTGDPAYYM